MTGLPKEQHYLLYFAIFGILMFSIFWPPVLSFSATVALPKTGQTTNYATGDDGDLEKGTSWPSPRFIDNSDGTITDNLTGLIRNKNMDRCA